MSLSRSCDRLDFGVSQHGTSRLRKRRVVIEPQLHGLTDLDRELIEKPGTIRLQPMNAISSLLLLALPLAAVPPQEAVVVKDIQFTLRDDKGMGTLHLFVNKDEDPVRFIKENRCVAGFWYPIKDRGKGSTTHWTGVLSYETFNFYPQPFYEIIKVRKQGQLEKLPAAARAKIEQFLFKRKRTSNVVLRETGQPNEYDLIGYTTDNVRDLFKLNKHFKYNAPPIPVWPGKAPNEPPGMAAKKAAPQTGDDGVIRIPYVDKPELIHFPAPPNKRTGTCIIVCPGGGYGKLAWNKEGTEVANWLNTLGVEAVALKYRVPRRDQQKPHPWPMQDLHRSIRLVRSQAAEWKIDPNRIGVLGFSAGGHLAVMSISQQGKDSYPAIDAIDTIDTQPNFMVLIYPAYLGNSKKDSQNLDPLVKVTSKTPPTFIAITHDDADRALFAALYYAELQRQRVPAELHIYSKGGHGYGLRPSSHPVSSWPSRLADWLQTDGWLTP